MSEEKFHLWYSQKSEEARARLACTSRNNAIFYKLDNGNIVRVSEATRVKHSRIEFDDVVYLGEGVFSHLE